MQSQILVILLVGVVVVLAGAVLYLASRVARGQSTTDAAAGTQREAERRAELDRLVDRARAEFERVMKAEFGNISLDALGKARDSLVVQGREQLDAKLAAGTQALASEKGLIDQTLDRISKQMAEELARLNATVRDLEKDREGKFGELSARLTETNEVARDLARTAGSLREALSSTTARGAWGERMAEDILRRAGFLEGVNYEKQKTIESSRLRPDFVFFLPKDLRLHMDVKFPLSNYLRYLDASTDADRARFRDDFVRDARARLKELAKRDYIDPGSNTIECVLLFIPNEQVYGFLHDADRTLLDDAIAHRIVLCSPFTLYAVLALIRQAIDNFNIERTSREILSLLGEFQAQWGKFVTLLERMGQRLDAVRGDYERLTTTRQRTLERSLAKIDALRGKRLADDGAEEGADRLPGQGLVEEPDPRQMTLGSLRDERLITRDD
jgi:DNA recombination protein RmuC